MLPLLFSIDDVEVNSANNTYHTDWNTKPGSRIGSIDNNHEDTER